jgi:hypothetical protein
MPPPPPTLNVDNVGYFFESFEVQLVTLCLISFDVIAAVATMLITCDGSISSKSQTLLNVLEVITGVCVPLSIYSDLSHQI